MKILHIAPDRDTALVAAPLIGGIAETVALTWVRTPASALGWLDDNTDASAVIVEVQAQSCASFVEEVRGRGLTIPVVVVAGSARLEPALAALNSGADGFVVAGPTLETELPRIVSAAIERERRRRQTVSQGLTAAAARLAYVQARHAVSLARETRMGLDLQQRLLELESALRKADERKASEAVSFAEQLTKRHAEFTASLAQVSQSRDALAADLSAATAVIGEARQARRADAAAAAEHLRQREVELDAKLAEAVAARTALERALADAEAAHERTLQDAATDLAAANERQAALEDLLAQEADRRTNLDRQLTAAEAAHEDADRRHAAELSRAMTALEDLQARYDVEVGEAAAARAALERHAIESAAALEQASRDRAAESASAAERLAGVEADLNTRLTDANAARNELEQTLSAARSAQQRAADDLAAAAAREADLEDRLWHETDRGVDLERHLSTVVTEHATVRASLEQRLADATTAHQQAEERATFALAAAAAREAELVERLANESGARAALEVDLAEHTGALRARDEEIRQHQLEQEALHRRLGTTHDQLQHLHRIVDEERQAHELARSTSEAELQRVSAEYGEIRQSFDQLQTAFQILEQVAGDHAAERARLGTVVAARDSELIAQADRHRIAEHAAQDALADVQARLRQTLDTGAFETARLRQEIDAARRELEATWTHAEALRRVAERVPDLRTELERSQSEQRAQFERAPFAVCRCSENGEITDANHSFVALLGCRRADDLRNKDFVAAALDSAGDLGWLLERARTTRKTETIETQWKTGDGRRLAIRLQALATATGSIELVAEDLTNVRALEARLLQAQRMEAVGRLASEVAVTCDAMLSDVVRGAEEWLAKVGSQDALRLDAERLLADVTRAASFLRRLGIYGHEQERALEPVSAQRVLRDLAPVLKRVAGERIEVVLPRSAGSFEVDVETERLERVLINVAGYARERMESGGQMKIALATQAVGRRFVARYPHVRPGEHVVITVTELAVAGQAHGDSGEASSASDTPGVDLGVLADLIASCGGHLWLEAQPAGNMVVKIHLPKPPVPPSADKRGGRLSRWLRSTPVAKVFTF